MNGLEPENDLGGGNSNILKIFIPIWGFMIQFDGVCIFFRWVGEKPPTSDAERFRSDDFSLLFFLASKSLHRTQQNRWFRWMVQTFAGFEVRKFFFRFPILPGQWLIPFELLSLPDFSHQMPSPWDSNHH